MARASRKLTWRLFIVFAVTLLPALGILARLFSLQILNHREYLEAAIRQQGDAEAAVRRGTIYFQDKEGKLQAAALNKNLYTLSANPREIESLTQAAESLAGIISMPPEEISRKLSQKTQYVVLARKLDDDAVRKLRLLELKGITWESESRRIYPGETLAANVLGFVSFEKDKEEGKYGIERLFDRELSGKSGFLEGVSGSPKLLVSLGRRIVHPPENGKNMVLTIDYNIQRELEKGLDNLMQKWTPERGYGAVVDPTTGKILAMASRPSFDPNNYGKAGDIANFPNPLVESSYELGSVMKPVTMASAINEKAVTPAATYYDAGEVRIKGYTIRNFDLKAHGTQTMTQVLEKSLNTGAVFAEEKLGDENFLKYLKAFGFGEKSGIDLPGEIRGNLSNLDARRDIDFATAAFGQGIAVTPLQMIMAASAIANGGNLLRPYIVEKLVDDAGVEEVTKPEVRRQVISRETSEAVSKMLVAVTRSGFDNHAGVKGFFVAGKTGTAQIPNPGARGYSSDVIHSFIGYAPAFRPKFLVYFQLVRPKGVNFASASLTPAFHEVANYILNYYGVPPDEP